MVAPQTHTTGPAQPLLEAKVGALGLLLEGVTSFTLRCYQYLHFLGDASPNWCVQRSRRAGARPRRLTLTPWGSATLPVSTSPSSFSCFTISLVLIESGKLVCSFFIYLGNYFYLVGFICEISKGGTNATFPGSAVAMLWTLIEFLFVYILLKVPS